MNSTAVTLVSAQRRVTDKRLVFRLSEITVVSTFAVLLLGSLWVWAGIMTRAVENTALLHAYFPTGVGLFMAIAATALWTWMLPNLVEFVGTEYRFMTSVVRRAVSKGGN